MKRGNLRTARKYFKIDGKNVILFEIQVKKGGIWYLGREGERRLIFDLEYDACVKLLSLFERGPIYGQGKNAGSRI
jgi:hypothetical protein